MNHYVITYTPRTWGPGQEHDTGAQHRVLIVADHVETALRMFLSEWPTATIVALNIILDFKAVRTQTEFGKDDD